MLADPVSDDEDVEEADTIPIDQQYGENIGAPVPAAKEELDEISIAQEISRYMYANKINIAEINDVVEMWGLCDAISAAHSGLPDSLLKEAFNLVLEGYYGNAQNNGWMRNHVDHLSRMWRKEMIKAKSTPRQTKFVSSSVNLAVESTVGEEEHFDEEQQKHEEGEDSKQPKEIGIKQQLQGDHGHGNEKHEVKDKAYFARVRRQRKQAAKRKRALATMMGVGQLLDHARRKFATEDGELDVDEDEFGNFMIGGMELDFETWGKLNKIKDAGVVSAGAGMPPQKRWKSSKRPENGNGSSIQHNNFNSAPQPPNLTPTTNMAEQYPTVGEVEMPEETTTTGHGKIGGAKKMVGKKAQQKLAPKEEKDEGEISSSESDKPTSSSEDEAEYQMHAAKHNRKTMTTKKRIAMAVGDVGGQQQMRAKDRRIVRREEERQQGASNAQNLQVLLRKCFDLRGKIVRKLTLSQKAAFMDLMKQSMAGNLQPNAQHQQQHQALAQLLGGMQQQQHPQQRHT